MCELREDLGRGADLQRDDRVPTNVILAETGGRRRER